MESVVKEISKHTINLCNMAATSHTDSDVNSCESFFAKQQDRLFDLCPKPHHY